MRSSTATGARLYQVLHSFEGFTKGDRVWVQTETPAAHGPWIWVVSETWEGAWLPRKCLEPIDSHERGARLPNGSAIRRTQETKSARADVGNPFDVWAPSAVLAQSAAAVLSAADACEREAVAASSSADKYHAPRALSISIVRRKAATANARELRQVRAVPAAFEAAANLEAPRVSDSEMVARERKRRARRAAARQRAARLHAAEAARVLEAERSTPDDPPLAAQTSPLPPRTPLPPLATDEPVHMAATIAVRRLPSSRSPSQSPSQSPLLLSPSQSPPTMMMQLEDIAAREAAAQREAAAARRVAAESEMEIALRDRANQRLAVRLERTGKQLTASREHSDALSSEVKALQSSLEAERSALRALHAAAAADEGRSYLQRMEQQQSAAKEKVSNATPTPTQERRNIVKARCDNVDFQAATASPTLLVSSPPGKLHRRQRTPPRISVLFASPTTKTDGAAAATAAAEKAQMLKVRVAEAIAGGCRPPQGPPPHSTPRKAVALALSTTKTEAKVRIAEAMDDNHLQGPPPHSTPRKARKRRMSKKFRAPTPPPNEDGEVPPSPPPIEDLYLLR